METWIDLVGCVCYSLCPTRGCALVLLRGSATWRRVALIKPQQKFSGRTGITQSTGEDLALAKITSSDETSIIKEYSNL